MPSLTPTDADHAVKECLENNRSFAVIAGAGSGKTASLIQALDEIRRQKGKSLRQNGQRIACITYTRRAAEVIRSRLGFDDLYHVTTLHSFLWGEIGRFQSDIRDALQSHVIPELLAKAREKDTGKATKGAIKAREKVERLTASLAGIAEVQKFKYDDSSYSDYLAGLLSHDDIIEISGFLLAERPLLRRLLGFQYPYIFVDEAQDTFSTIASGLNLVANGEGLPVVGYFGDPWQQIYEDKRAGAFTPPDGGLLITKVENFRSAQEVIDFLNAFRTDVHQVPAGENRELQGSVRIRLVKAEEPEGERKRYSAPQVERALLAMDQAIDAWGWAGREDVVRLFLVRQMIARRLGFSNLNELFTGQFSSMRSKDEYESGEHYLLKPFIATICPLITSHLNGESRKVIDLLRLASPAYSVTGPNASRTLKAMIDRSNAELQELSEIWNSGTVRDVLHYCSAHALISVTERLRDQLERDPRQEEYVEEEHAEDKGDWLADRFFAMPTSELHQYSDFILENTAYSTQHGVKGEQYNNVMVVFDDVEAAWNLYSFTKLLTPQTAGDPTDGQRERGRKLAYVCFSRARENLRILLFTTNPESAKRELINKNLLREDQVEIA